MLAAVLEVGGDQRVAFRGWSAYPLPELCPARAWFDGNCPGCGLTRGLIRLAHAEWSAAIEVHRLSGLIAFAIFVQIPYRIACLWSGKQPCGDLAPRVFAWFLIGALLLNWAVVEFRPIVPDAFLGSGARDRDQDLTPDRGAYTTETPTRSPPP